MLRFFNTTTLATVAAAMVALAPHQAQSQSYQIDCAILLCLSGGWPASVPCARARAEFIRRITPWPVEPPLQIWRCPMGASYTGDPERLNADRIYEILQDLNDVPQQSYQSAPLDAHSRNALLPQPAVVRYSGGPAERLPEGFALQTIQSATTGADIDISDPAFNFVRSIRVFHVIRASQHESHRDGDCKRKFRMRVGTYGPQGSFEWHYSTDISSLPASHVGLEQYWSECPKIHHRSVFVDWRDHDGNYGYEQVNY